MRGKRQKILYIITKSNWGGAQRYVYDLAVNLPKAKFEVSVAFGGDGPLKVKLEEAGVKTHVIEGLERDVSFSKDILVAHRLSHLIRDIRPDVVHLNSSKIGGLGAIAARLSRVKKIIFTAHGFAFNEDRGFFEKLLIGLASWLTVLLVSQTISVSKFDKKSASWMPFVKRKIITIQNGIGPTNFLDKSSARERMLAAAGVKSVKSDTLFLGTISELTKNKGLRYAIAGMEELKKNKIPFHFFIIGDGEEKDSLTKFIKNKRLGGHVHMLGRVEEAAKYVKAFDVFLLSSIKEGLPYTILEAGLAGVSVVTTAAGGIPEIVSDMESGILVKPKSPDEIAKAISYLYKNGERRDELGGTLQKKVRSFFSMRRMVGDTVAIYK